MEFCMWLTYPFTVADGILLIQPALAWALMFLAPDGKEIPALTELKTSREISAHTHTHTHPSGKEDRTQQYKAKGQENRCSQGWKWRSLPGMSFLGSFPLIAGSKLAQPSKGMNMTIMPFMGNDLSSRYLKEYLEGSGLSAYLPCWICPDARSWVPLIQITPTLILQRTRREIHSGVYLCMMYNNTGRHPW